MSSIMLERKNDVANPVPTDQAVIGKQGVQTGIGTYLAGTRVLLRCRTAQFYINATTCPGGGAFHYNLEGPYLRIYPAASFNGEKDAILRRNRGAERYSTSAGIIHADDGNMNPQGDEFYYEVDAANCSVYLPFDCSLALYTDFSGIWLYDLYTMGRGWSEDVNNVPNTNLTQTRNVGGGNTRYVPVPVGAHSAQIIGDSSTVVTPGLSDVTSTLDKTSDQILGAVVGGGIWPGIPSTIANARGFNIATSALGKDASITYGISVP